MTLGELRAHLQAIRAAGCTVEETKPPGKVTVYDVQWHGMRIQRTSSRRDLRLLAIGIALGTDKTIAEQRKEKTT